MSPSFRLSDNLCSEVRPYKPRTRPLRMFDFDEHTPLGKIMFTLIENAEEAEAAKAEANGDDDYEAAYERARDKIDGNFCQFHREAFALLTDDEKIGARLAGYAPLAKFNPGFSA